MRDINRIIPFCQKLANVWMNFPDWRFGQFIVNFLKWCGADPFYLEDDKFEGLLLKFVEEIKK